MGRSTALLRPYDDGALHALPFAAPLASLARVLATISRNLRAVSTISWGLLDFRASGWISSPPMPRAAAPASMNSAAVERLTPPVGASGICGSGPFSALMDFAPPTWPHRHIFTKSEPAGQA